MHSPLNSAKKSPVLNYNYNEQRAQTPLQKLKKSQSELAIDKGFGSAILRCIIEFSLINVNVQSFFLKLF